MWGKKNANREIGCSKRGRVIEGLQERNFPKKKANSQEKRGKSNETTTVSPSQKNGT